MQTPAPVTVPSPPPAPGQVIIRPGVNAPQAVYRAFNEQRKELANQLDNLEGKRRDLAQQVADPEIAKSVKSGLELRVAELDKRIADVDKQLAAADQSVANAAAVPGAVIEPPPEAHNSHPGEFYPPTGVLIVTVLFALSIAYGLRIWKRGASVITTAFPQELSERLDRLDQSMDSIAIEVERIGEGQRFVTRVMSENGRAIGAGAAQPIEVAAREKSKVGREADRT
ncbi:hypothetical protein BH11GEM1_BH11GEM1_34540 [soil metagenome]